MSDNGQDIKSEIGCSYEPEMGFDLDTVGKAGIAATEQAGEQLIQLGAQFLDSMIGKIILTLVAGVITGGAGAALLGPVLASMSYALPAALIGETSFLTDWTNDMFAYTNAPQVIAVPGLSENIAKDTSRAMAAIQAEMIDGDKAARLVNLSPTILNQTALNKMMEGKDVYNDWYRQQALQIIGINSKVTETPAQLARRLGVREDAAAMAISVWNATERPDMSKYDPATGFPKNVFLGSTSLGEKGAAVRKFAATLSISNPSKTSAAMQGVKTMAAASQPKPSAGPYAAVLPEPFYKTSTVRTIAPIGAAGLGLGGALLAGLGGPITAAIALGAGGATYLLTRKG